MKHAKAEVSPSEYKCPKCGKQLVYRFGKNGRFLSCSGYPKCKYACPCDRDGKMIEAKESEHKCPVCGKILTVEPKEGYEAGCGYCQSKLVLKIEGEDFIFQLR
jgi:DNA topoisomerase-1